MTIKFQNNEEFLRFIKKCKSIGVTRIKMGTTEFELSPDAGVPVHRPKKKATSKALATKPDGVSEEMTELELDQYEFEMNQLRINDPEAFEELEMKRLSERG